MELYAVGFYHGYDEVDRESLIYFKNFSDANAHFYKRLAELDFMQSKPYLALFYIKDNYIRDIYYLNPIHESSKIGPVGPIVGTESIK